MLREEIIDLWKKLEEKIINLLSDLDSTKSNQTVVIERYEKRLQAKNEQIIKLETKLEEDDPGTFHQAVLREIRLMIRIPANASEEQFLEIVKNLRKDYRGLRGLDGGGN